jgi:uncharacterized protein YndB with AHSA1/START domain
MKSELKISENRLQITRVFDAPRERVFAAWKQADLLQQWWGCKDTTKVDSKMDFRPGGSFTQKMQITGVGEFALSGAYDEIVEPERIAYHAEFGPVTVRVTVEFIALGAQTKIVLTQDGLPSRDICERVSEGTTDAFDKLDQLLARQRSEVAGISPAVATSALGIDAPRH